MFPSYYFLNAGVSQKPQPKSGMLPYAAVRIMLCCTADLSGAQYNRCLMPSFSKEKLPKSAYSFLYETV